MKHVSQERLWTPDEYKTYQESGYRHNFVANVMDVSLYQFGNSLMNVNVVLPALLVTLGASDSALLWLPAIQILIGRLPQIFTAHWAERLHQRLPSLKFTGIFQRLPWALIGLTLLLLHWGIITPAVAIAAIFGCVGLATIAYAITAPVWGDFIALVIPERVRGRFMGFNVAIGNALGLLGGAIVTAVLSATFLPYPTNYATLCFLMTIVIFGSYYAICQNREPRLAPASPHKDPMAYFRELPELLRTDRSLIWLLISSALSFAYIFGVGLFMAYGMNVLGVQESQVGLFVMVQTAATLAAGFGLGFLTDRVGHKVGLLVGLVAYVGAAVLAVMAPSVGWLFPVFVLLAVFNSSQFISTNNLIFSMAPPARRPTYLALASTLPAPFVLVFTLLGKWLLKGGGEKYLTDILLSAMPSLAPWLNRGHGAGGYALAFAGSALLVTLSALALWFGVKIRNGNGAAETPSLTGTLPPPPVMSTGDKQ